MFFILSRLKRKILAAIESLRYSLETVTANHQFIVVSCERNSGEFAIKCLDSVYSQKYQRDKVTHVFIDDASDDGTHEKIVRWLETHLDHNVRYIRNSVRRGGTFNTVFGMKTAPDSAIVIELNGDDWLPDNRVLDFFNTVYADDATWMTYNTLRINNGPPVAWARKFSRRIVENNFFRDQREWGASHLHTFRKKLFDHIDAQTFIDPETGDYWECADDQALYLSLLELAGSHSRHIYRITCVYNFWESSHCYHESEKSVATAGRIRKLPRYQPLAHL